MNTAKLFDLTSTVVVAYVSRNRITQSGMIDLIVRVHACLSALAAVRMLPSEAQIAASVRRSRIVSFIDGKAYKSLAWHLALHGLTPDAYRARYGLPDTYPMLAPSYDRGRLSGSRGASGRRRAGT